MAGSAPYLFFGRDANNNAQKIRLVDSGQKDELDKPIYDLAVASVARPPDVGLNGGAYEITGLSGTIAANLGGGSNVFAFRLPAAPALLAVIGRIAVAMNSLGTGFTAGVGQFALFPVRGAWTGGAGGQNAIDLSAGAGRLRTSYPNSQEGAAAITISNTGALGALTGGSVDGSPLTRQIFGVNASTNAVQLATTNLLNQDNPNESPLILVAQEGFLIQATVPATGTWQMAVTVSWAEVAAF